MPARTKKQRFEILMEPDEDGFHVWCPALPGCNSFGLTRQEALANIKEAIEGWLEGAQELGIPILEREVVTVEAPGNVEQKAS